MNKKITLKEILEIYKDLFQNKTFEYTLTNGQTLKIKIYKEQICHLLGIQHIYDNDKHYLGKKGYELIEDEKMTVETLKKHNLTQFNFIKERLIYFNEIYEILTKGELIKFFKDRTYPKSNIRADFILYKDGEQKIFHLFLCEEYKSNYAPISFVVKSKNEVYSKQYIQNQEYKKIEKIRIYDSSIEKSIEKN